MAIVAFILTGCGPVAEGQDPTGRLQAHIVEVREGALVPARLELTRLGRSDLVPPESLVIPRGECLEVAMPLWLRPATEVGEIQNHYTGTRQFYADGELATDLPPGRYRLRAFKGIEHRVAETEFEILARETTDVRLELERWIDLPSLGWYGADGHLHIPRRDPVHDPRLATWMRAEDLHVASFLQGGSARRFDIARQYAFGKEGLYRGERILLVPGQEHPRTHLLGHTTVLGPAQAIDRRDVYLQHEVVWREAKRLGGLAGYAHWGLGAGQHGLAVDAPTGLLSFLEVLGFDYANYESWYDLLDLGIRLAPTAGSDYPCNPYTHPGRERFYTYLPAGLDAEAWKESIRAGRTFVTNGPFVGLKVEGAGPGDTLRFDSPTRVRVRGTVRFDPARDRVETVELIRNGEPLQTELASLAHGEVMVTAVVDIAADSWFGLRAAGWKEGEGLPPRAGRVQQIVQNLLPRLQGGAPFAERFARTGPAWPSFAHTGAIFVEIGPERLASDRPTARLAAQRWLSRLEALRARLEPDELKAAPTWPISVGDGIAVEEILRDRAALIRAIDRAAEFYRAVAVE